MNIVQFTDDYNNARVGFIFAYDPIAKDALKAALPFPKCKWDGGTKSWAVLANQTEIDIAIATLNEHGYDFSDFRESIELSAPKPLAQFKAPDVIVLDYPFQSNHKALLKAVKQKGTAKWNQTKKHWSIPLHHAHEIAHSFATGMINGEVCLTDGYDCKYEELAQAIRDIPEVGGHAVATAARVNLSQAVRIDDEQELARVKSLVSPQGVPMAHQLVAPAMFTVGDQHRLLIADEPGLGKSLQALMCIDAANLRKTLIVCPANVKYTWLHECNKWFPYHSAQVLKNGADALQASNSFTIINYELMDKRVDELIAADFDSVIFDESHYLKNEKAKRTQACIRLARWPTIKGHLCLSGTPILNRPSEFYTVLSMMLPGTFGNFFDYARKYCGAYQHNFGWDFSGATNIDKSEDDKTTPLNHVLRDVMLRRTYDDEGIVESMPDLVQTIIHCDLSKDQRVKYDADLDRWLDEYDRLNAMGGLPQGYTLNMLTELRHSCGMMKAKHAVDWARDYRSKTGKPLVIFAHHRDVIRAITDGLHGTDACVGTITGETPAEFRQKFVDEFQAGSIDFLVCSTLAAKEGITLTNADTTLFVEREWVPAHEQQAAHRVRRLSQTSSTCHQVILSATNCIDTHFDEVVRQKADVVKRTLDGDAEERAKGDIVNSLVASLLGVNA